MAPVLLGLFMIVFGSATAILGVRYLRDPLWLVRLNKKWTGVDFSPFVTKRYIFFCRLRGGIVLAFSLFFVAMGVFCLSLPNPATRQRNDEMMRRWQEDSTKRDEEFRRRMSRTPGEMATDGPEKK